MGRDMKTAVLTYLMDHYGLKELAASELISKHHTVIARAIEMSSKPYYPADQIATAEGLDHLEICPTCLKEQDELETA